METRKLAFTALFMAVGVLSAHLVYIPIGVAKCFPVQHTINVLLAVLIGTQYSTGAAFGVAILRNILGTGSLLAFPGSVIGAEHVARSPAEGYTLLMNSAQATVPAIVARMPYDTLKDFVGIAVAGFSPHVLVVNPQVRAQTAQELLALLRANPGRTNFASAGLGSGVHLAGELFRARTNTQFEIVHYRGGGPGVAALVSGESQFGTPTMASSIGQVRGGGVRVLAVLAEQRSPALPQVPSAPEAGLPGVIHEEFFPILAPAGTPPAAVAALGAAFRTAIQQNAAKLTEMAGVSPRAGYETSDQVMGLVGDGVRQYTAILRAAGVEPQ